jgi:hypothetical protein
MEIEALTDRKGIEDTLSIPIGSSPIESFTIFYDLMEASTNFFKRSLVIIKMGIHNVHVV